MPSIIDSKKNCRISCLLPEPSVFLTPTSFALFSERAVERFMKLTQAINNNDQGNDGKESHIFDHATCILSIFEITVNLHLFMGKVK